MAALLIHPCKVTVIFLCLNCILSHDLLCLSITTVPSEPVNLTYENVTAASIRLHWDPPTEPNGVLESYKLMYVEAETERVVIVGNITLGMESEGYLVEPLLEYHRYVMMVAASTDKGFGNYSLPLNVLTDEHGTYIHHRTLTHS